MSGPSLLAENVQRVRRRIAAAAQRSGRPAAEITLVAVSKYVAVHSIQQLIDAGCCDFGESRPQDLAEKAEAIADPRVRWHLVGHLQRNKIRRVLPASALIHSVDSARLLDAIDRIAAEIGVLARVLIEVNVSGDATKHGLPPERVAALLAESVNFEQVQVCGLMTMAAREGDDETARRNFRDLRQLRDRLRADVPDNVQLEELSMGMSGDFEIAIEEGATMVRVGSALFEGLAADD